MENKARQKEIANKIVKDGLSVRATERLAEKIKDDDRPERKKRKTSLSYASLILAVFHLFLVCTVHTFSHYIMLSSNSKFNF